MQQCCTPSAARTCLRDHLEAPELGTGSLAARLATRVGVHLADNLAPLAVPDAEYLLLLLARALPPPAMYFARA